MNRFEWVWLVLVVSVVVLGCSDWVGVGTAGTSSAGADAPLSTCPPGAGVVPPGAAAPGDADWARMDRKVDVLLEESGLDPEAAR